VIKKILTVSSILVLASAAFGWADTITLVGPINNHNYQQTTNSPCVIGNPSCNNPAGFNDTTIPANPAGHTYHMVASPIYTVSQIESVVASNAFWVGIDINQTETPQTLDYFAMKVNGVVVDLFSTLTSVPSANNGNGFADYLLETFKLAGFAGTDSVQFVMDMPLANDGAEQFFLIGAESTPPPPPPPSVPEPGTFALLGSGLVSMAGLLARRKAVQK
jgi:PEP-CTERM motif